MNELCPYCDGNGILYDAIIKKLNLRIKICDECDCIWMENEWVSNNTGIAYWLFAENHNFEALWSELEILGISSRENKV